MQMNTSSQAEQQMNTTLLNHPGFQSLPQGVKRSPLAARPHSPNPPVPHQQRQKGAAPQTGSQLKRAQPLNRPLTFGDFVAGVYHAWGKRRATGIIDLAIKVHVIEFLGTERFVVS
jgi:hypothetical protein